jgi:hypothetical protein
MRQTVYLKEDHMPGAEISTIYSPACSNDTLAREYDFLDTLPKRDNGLLTLTGCILGLQEYLAFLYGTHT